MGVTSFELVLTMPILPVKDAMNEIRSLPNQELRMLGNQGFALALRMLRHREDAADAVQDAMHQMIRKQAAFDIRRGSLKAWFLKIVRNRCLDMLRKKRPATGCEWFDPVDADQMSPQQPSQQAELQAAVQQALATLATDSREIILLRDFDALSYAEIGQVLGIAQGTVMSRLHRSSTIA